MGLAVGAVSAPARRFLLYMGLPSPVLAPVLLGALVVAMAACGGSPMTLAGADKTAVSRTLSNATGPGATLGGCRQDPHSGVHDPDRLTVLNACAQFEGTVAEAPKLNPSDGDVTFDAAPDGAFAAMLNDKNRSEGGIHIEIVPMDQPGCTPGEPIKGNVGNLGVCSGANVVFPPLGAHIRVTGVYVFDTWVGKNEIHPAWRVEILPLQGPPPPERHVLEARLSGKAVGPRGAVGGVGNLTFVVTGTKLCWRFAGVRGIDTPVRAAVRRGGVRETGPVVLTLGATFRSKGCTTAAISELEPVVENPIGYYVVVSTRMRPAGAIRGQLAHASD